MIIELIPLESKDSDIFGLKMIHKMSSVAKFISISDNYFDYVTGTKGVTYYKIYCDDELVGSIHCEKTDGTMYLSICIDEKRRRMGIAEASLNHLFLILTNDINIVEVSIDDNNLPSIALFKKTWLYTNTSRGRIDNITENFTLTNYSLSD
ncbi:MAG: GNAT family N-acetyltransferase [Eubacteriales bacterium]|jgi:RimJ/RimL family protein N-acetyltransferase